VACLAAVLGFSALDAALFRTDLYASYLEPDSSAGQFELILRRERLAQQGRGDNVVLTLGDSRFAYSPRLCNELTPRSGLVFRNAGVAGTDARAWYYMLRDLDPGADRYRALVFGVEDFDDVDDSPDHADDERTLHYVIHRLRLSDVPDFASSFHDPELRWQAWRGGLWKGFIHARDIREFLSHPRQRVDYVHLCRQGFEEWTYGYVESAETMVGVDIDWENGRATFPPGANQNQRDTVNSQLASPPVPQVRLAEFRRRWFGRIVERYRGRRTTIVFVQLPRGPFPRPASQRPRAETASLRELASPPGVVLGDAHAFDFLEHPELFKDGTHLNREGIARFSPRLVDEIARILGQSPRP
jgi:hypothetical protein